MPITVILGEQRGDEGKGRFVDMLAAEHDIVARFNGGNNAGHTVCLPDGRVLKLHLIPSGIAHTHTLNIIGNGCLVNPVKLEEEIDQVRSQGITLNPDVLKLSSAAHLILPHHISADEIREAGKSGQGSTKSGIAQVSADKYGRVGYRCEAIITQPDELRSTILKELVKHREIRSELGLEQIDEEAVANEYMRAAENLTSYICDTVVLINERINNSSNPAKVLAEGAQAFLLDIDHGMYPFTTSSSTTSGSVATGLGVPPQKIGEVLGVSKAVQSHVGGGTFVTEINDEELLANLHGDFSQVDAERGTTTGRTRRLGHLDLPGIRRSQMINGTKAMALTKLDWIPRYGETVKICTKYLVEGREVEIAPDSAASLMKAQPIYEELPAWKEDIQEVREFDRLPLEAQKYIEFIEQKTGVPISYIGVGPNREQVIIRGRNG
jgi:adenylosuccinate synthase